nr:SAM-dependent DNA methyltransferase [Leifsonia naganoensis]
MSLVDADGPFLSKAALKSSYRSGLPKPDASADDMNATFIAEFDRWSKEWSSATAEEYNASRDRWVEVVLRRLLDWSGNLQLAPAGVEAHSPNSSVAVTAWAALNKDGAPAALVTVVDRTNNLRAVGTDGWSANAIDRMSVLLRQSGVSIGVVTDGRWWALVSAATDVATASGVWDALLWREERPSRDAFLALASFTSIAGGLPELRLPLLFAESIASAEQITEALGDQVRRAVELVLQSMSDVHLRALGQGEKSPLPADPKAVYEGAVTMLMRIVFLLFAEERGLLPEHQLYRGGYAIADLRQQLQRQATETSAEALDHSWEAWHRLLAASNAVYGGASFEDMRMPAYGGSLFDPSRFPWLQATDAQGRLRVRLTDRAMAAVLRAVQTIENGAMQLSFRDLDVEQIGYVYEGLLGYSAEYADEIIVGLKGKSGFEPEIRLLEMEAIAAASTESGDFGLRLSEYLKDAQAHAKPRTPNQLARDYVVVNGVADARTRLRHALLGNDELVARLLPFRGLVRDDLRGFPYVVPTNGLVMTESPQRANTGTHYTPRSLAEEIVLHALEPLVYSPGPLDTENADEWVLKSSAEILDLKVADIAAGSGAFLVAAARYLADRLIEARGNEGLDVSTESGLERWAVREIVARCLYGADINGMAVEMCKLSLWLISMDPGKPFSFVDDRIFHGNSLLGVTSEAQLKAQHINSEKREAKSPLRWFDVDKDIADAARVRRELTSGQVDDADRMRSTRAKRALLDQSKYVISKLRDVADGIIAAGLLEGGKPGRNLEARYDELADALHEAYPANGGAPKRERLDAIIESGLTPTANTGERSWKPLHWILEAPDVLQDGGGFDAIVGNPPFLGGPAPTRAFGLNYREWLRYQVGGGKSGAADLVAYFLLRADSLLRPGRSTFGLITTNTISEGDTREVGLDQVLTAGRHLYRSVKSAPWTPLNANVSCARIWGASWLNVQPICEGERVVAITPQLEAASRVTEAPVRLSANRGICFKGSNVYGDGFVISLEQAQSLVAVDERNASVVFPFPEGKIDLNGSPSQQASRAVINFRRWSEDLAKQFDAPYRHVERKVKPIRATNARKSRRERWWQFGDYAGGMEAAIESLQRVIVLVLHSKTVMPMMLPTGQVFGHALGVFATEDFADLAFLSSVAHHTWAITYGSTLETRIRYTPSDVFETLPRPQKTARMRELGEQLDRDRREIMLRRELGLTTLYNLVHSPNVVGDPDVDLVRAIHLRIDEAVMDAYGWGDIHLQHGFFVHREVERWTVCPAARDEILDRLLKENKRRSEIETRSAPMRSKRAKSFEESVQPEGAMF